MSGRVKRLAFLVLVAVVLGLLTWLATTGMQTRIETQRAGQQAIRVAELRGTIAYLGEWRTMSAHMAVASGESRWIDRYEEAGPRLEAAIAEALRLATPEVGVQLSNTIREAHRDLIAMQATALRLARDGDRDGARALLEGPEFNYLEAVYAAGLDAFGRDLMSLSATRTRNLYEQAWREAGALAVSLILLVTVVVAARGHTRLQAALTVTEQVARTDALTGLPNRRQLHEALNTALMMEPRRGEHIAVLLLDLDRFKAINDTLGHAGGDALLVAVAARLREIEREGAVIARLGGDEFAIVASCGEGRSSADDLARLVLARLQEPFVLGGQEIRIGGSIGVACAPEHGQTGAQLFGRADLALYRAKAEGRNAHRVFDAAMDAAVAEREQLEVELRVALARDEFVLHYQPIADLGTGRIAGREALLRWQHPTRGLVAPGAFIPLAEETGVIVEVGAWALRQACLDAASWPDPMRVAVNVSAVQFQTGGLAPAVAAALLVSGLAPDRLELEITETVLLQDSVTLSSTLDALRGLGVRLALDDFGTGYSSLSYLRRFPFDKIKIDRAFTASITDPATAAIVGAIVTLSTSLGARVTAEGVETEAQWEAMRYQGCHEGQGFLIGRPQPIQGLVGSFAEPKQVGVRAA
jgi:diguanylate cyclase (GGDEF)-like protein